MDSIKAKPMIKLSGARKHYTLSGRFGIELNTEDRKVYTSDKGVEVREETYEYGGVKEVRYSVRNISDRTIKADHISSGIFDSIGGGLLPWYDDRKYRLHICYFTWQGEAQWRDVALSDMGLYKASNHEDVCAIRLRSIGNQSTAIYYPQIILEDKELNKTYFFELLTTSNWYIEISGNSDGTLKVELNSAFFNNDNWFLNLESGDEYNASPCAYAVVDGGFEDMVALITDYRRAVSKADVDVLPVCYNNYMNGTWGVKHEDLLIPAIDKAAEIGCELFCMDDGWQEPNKGDWLCDETKFPTYGFKGIIDYIKSKGMIAGAWLELNSAKQSSRFYKNYREFILKRNGDDIGSDGFCQPDFREKAVVDYMTEVVDRLYNAGIRFIKNDYNQTSGIGFDGRLCAGEEMRLQSLAFIKFIDMIKAKYPDLIIENCASGSMRTDGAMMRHFELVSVSDQEHYYNNPSILAGMQACVQPEKCGSWAYPYPQLFENRLLSAEEGVDTDPERNINETVFNMVNGMMGLMYMSGHIEFADEKNTKLMKDAIAIYKENREFIKSSYPIYPSGRFKMEKKGFYAYGLSNKDKSRILLAVWRIKSLESIEIFDLSQYIDSEYEVNLLYPSDYNTEYQYSNGKLSVKLEEDCTARLFEIKKRC